MELVELTHTQLRMDFERFRVINPSSEGRMIQSIKTHGQISPLLAGRFENERSWVLVDGFKRFRATQALKIERLRVWSVGQSMQALKAMVLTINREESPSRELEESLVLQSLHRDDGLQQQEIALLCNRHKSWVCRRIALIERLSEEVVEQLRLGLLDLSTARELLRLPRGNQNDIFEVIRKHRFSYRQSRLLIDAFIHKPVWQQKTLLENPASMIEELSDPRIDCGVFTIAALGLRRESNNLLMQMRECGIGPMTYEQRVSLGNTLDGVINKCESCRKQLSDHEVEA
jgi:ParB-like chromosome segregation protein Spo0J